MPSYRVDAMDATGLEIREYMEAESREEISTKMRQSGYFVTSVKEVPAKSETAKTIAELQKDLPPLPILWHIVAFLLGVVLTLIAVGIASS